MSNLKLYGFDGSTYVRTVRMLLAEKGASFEQDPVNVLAGETHQPAHLERQPFGKVPVIEHDGMKIYETGAIMRYLNEVLPGKSLIPNNAKDRARMDMAMSIFDSYGYGALVGVAGYHLFPDLIGGKNDDALAKSIESSRLVLSDIMKIKGNSDFIAGNQLTLADCYLAPMCFYVSLTEDAGKVFDIPGFAQWWERMQQLDSFKSTAPNLG